MVVSCTKWPKSVRSRVLEFKIEMTANKMTAPSTHLHNPPPALSDYRKPVQNVNLPKQQKHHKISIFSIHPFKVYFLLKILYSSDFWFNTIPLPASYFATYLRKYISKFGKMREIFSEYPKYSIFIKNFHTRSCFILKKFRLCGWYFLLWCYGTSPHPHFFWQKRHNLL